MFWGYSHWKPVPRIRLFFEVILSCLGRSMARSLMQSVRACEVAKHFPIFFSYLYNDALGWLVLRCDSEARTYLRVRKRSGLEGLFKFHLTDLHLFFRQVILSSAILESRVYLGHKTPQGQIQIPSENQSFVGLVFYWCLIVSVSLSGSIFVF